MFEDTQWALITADAQEVLKFIKLNIFPFFLILWHSKKSHSKALKENRLLSFL